MCCHRNSGDILNGEPIASRQVGRIKRGRHLRVVIVRPILSTELFHRPPRGYLGYVKSGVINKAGAKKNAELTGSELG